MNGVPPPPPGAPPPPSGGSVPPPPPPPPSSQHQPRSQPSSHHQHHRVKHEGEKRHQHHHSKEVHVKKEDPAAAAAAAAAQAHGRLDARLRRDTPFLASIRFKNDLPEIPSDPKMLIGQQAPEKLAAFALTALEKEPKRDLILPPDLGITISLLDAERFAVPPGPNGAPRPPLDPADITLLGGEEESKALLAGPPLPGLALAGSAASRPPAPRRGANLRTAGEVSWLMKTTYISNDSDAVRKPGYNEKQAKSLRQAAEAATQGIDADAELETSREAQIAAIEATFAAARQPPVHPTKPGMRAVEVLEVLPDWDWWGHKLFLAHFDSDPTHEVEALAKLPDPAMRHKVAARSMLKGFKLDSNRDEAGGKDGGSSRFMALVVPADPAVAAQDGTGEDGASRGVPAEALEGEYRWSKEYMYDLIRKEGGADADGMRDAGNRQYVLRFVGGRALYSDLNAVMELRKRDAGAKARERNAAAAMQFERPSKINIRKRDATGAELDDCDRRRRALLPPDMRDRGGSPGFCAEEAGDGAAY